MAKVMSTVYQTETGETVPALAITDMWTVAYLRHRKVPVLTIARLPDAEGLACFIFRNGTNEAQRAIDEMRTNPQVGFCEMRDFVNMTRKAIANIPPLEAAAK